MSAIEISSLETMPPGSPNQRTYGGETAAERAESRARKLDESAAQIIGEEGFKAATVRAVCERAGLTQRYYYQRYADAEDMLVTVYRQKLDVIESAVSTAVGGARSPVEIARAGLTAVFELIRDDPGLGRIVFLEVLGVSARVDDAYRSGTQRFVNVITALFRPAVNEGLRAKINEDIIGHAAIGAIIQVAVHWILSDFDHPIEDIVENLEIVIGAVTSGLTTPA